MSKKVKKIILITIASILGLIILDFLVLKLVGFGPVFAIKTSKKDDVSKTYSALFYKVWKCNPEGKTKDIVVKYFGKNYACNTDSTSFEIVDETETCAQALEEIARDDRFIYYLSCMKSSTVFLKYENGTKISVKEALATKKVTIEELDDKGIIFVEVINPQK